MLRHILLPFFCLCYLHLGAQVSVVSVEFEGVKRTSTQWLSRFIDQQPGVILDSAMLDADLQNLKNLNSIAGGQYRVIYSENGAQIVFELEEVWTLFPIINFGGIEGNTWFQLGVNDVNFLGQGMQLTADYRRFDGRNNFNLFYKVPNIRGGRWGTSISLLRYASVEPLFFDELEVPYRYTNLSATVTGMYEIARDHIIEAGISGFQEDYLIDEDSLQGIGPGPDALTQPKMLAKVLHRYAALDYHYFYLDGFDINSNAQAVYNIDLDSWFLILLTDIRGFHLFNKTRKYPGNLAYRIRFGISSNEDSPFAPFVLDSQVNIRGSGNRIDRGTGVVVFNLEYRQTLYENERFGAQAVLFSDLGTWRSPGGDFSELTSQESLRHFMGGGIRLVYKKAYDAILRLDYGVDIYNSQERGLVIGVGQYF